MKKAFLFAAVAVFSLSGVAVAGDAAAGKGKYNVCAGCHGAKGEGNDALKAPKLAGHDAAYISKQLTDFKSGARAGTTMPAMVASLSEADIENIAAYIATLK